MRLMADVLSVQFEFERYFYTHTQKLLLVSVYEMFVHL